MTSELRDRVARLSLESKVRLLTGRTGWTLHAAPGAGLLPITVSDGPAGVRGTEATQDEHSASLPSPTAVAAAWDTALMERAGRFFAAEARRKDVDVVLAPVLNLHRSPVGGRHFECLSEDPHLTAELGAAFVRALQGEGVGACPKHFIGNETECERTSYRARIDERTLREVYLPPFEAALDAGAWTVMAAYNGVDDGVESHSMTDHHRLLTGLLKDELGFDGVVVSDWAAARSTAPSANAGLDLVMPGPRGPWSDGDALLAAVRAGEVAEEVVDDKVERLLRLAGRVGKLDRDTSRPVEGEDERAALREIGARGHVLLRNEGGLLPLAPAAPRRVALIGPNAVDPHTQGGGSAHVTSKYLVGPVEGLREALPEDVDLTVVRGGDPRRHLPVLAHERLTRLDLTLHDAAGRSLGARPVAEPAFHVDVAEPDAVRAAVTAEITLTEPGTHHVEVGVVGRHTVRVDGLVRAEGGRTATEAEILESRHSHPDGPRVALEVTTAPRRVRVEIDTEVADFGGFGRGVIAQLRHRPPGPTADEEIARAVGAAAEADVAIVVVGTNDEVESEGYDRPDLHLPGHQDELVRRVAAANPRTVVVVNAGAPVLLPWLDDVPAVLWSWFGGQEYGHALADTLTGRAEPTGRLPWTLPRAHADVPFLDTRPTDGVLAYDEGVFVGHRAYDRDGREPHRPFGFGLGYTRWDLTRARLTGPPPARGGDGLLTAPVRVTATVANTGARPGRHVVQVYVEPPADEAGTARPLRSLAAFASVPADPGEHATVHLDLPPRAFAVWDTDTRSWRTPEGTYHLAVGSSSRAIAHRLPLQVR
ncbi:beta-glucosidase family protein [Nocardiopsis aegyptia]|uniref:Beta-glucosidase n=1 Tax=Nocardiopsis aegyptia TaxID=220378 RepID=A0A7Z0EI48_9ACTN|nr:glycoside hydrolase family 3 C-terminal domain-containing protein [Nocardiopsis aegyptia]NYJ32474.1 beta-glucosidase [Nocardiopsis aegyptia]